jgi:hypothetical protein
MPWRLPAGNVRSSGRRRARIRCGARDTVSEPVDKSVDRLGKTRGSIGDIYGFNRVVSQFEETLPSIERFLKWGAVPLALVVAFFVSRDSDDIFGTSDTGLDATARAMERSARARKMQPMIEAASRALFEGAPQGELTTRVADRLRTRVSCQIGCDVRTASPFGKREHCKERLF